MRMLEYLRMWHVIENSRPSAWKLLNLLRVLYVWLSRTLKGKGKNPRNGSKYGAAGDMVPEKVSTIKHKRGKHVKKDKSKLKCFNHGEKGHFIRECTKLKKVLPNLDTRNLNVDGHVMVV